LVAFQNQENIVQTTNIVLTSAASLVTISIASAATVDGQLGVGDSYGTPIVVQDTQTNFGDNNDSSIGTANGSEIDAAYGEISNGNLNLLLTGNIETNFNKLQLFFDTGTGGENKLTGNSGSFLLDNQAGLTFDTGFDADYFLSVGAEFDNGTPTIFNDFFTISSAGNSGGGIGNRPIDGTAQTLTNGITVALNNSNLGGVDGGIGPATSAQALTATTGLELSIPLSVLGNPTGSIDVVAYINGGGSDFLSNQVLGGIGGGDNLGGASGVNFQNVTGDQFFTVVPEPTALAGVALLGLVGLRRRR
jgi:hypothetical protein